MNKGKMGVAILVFTFIMQAFTGVLAEKKSIIELNELESNEAVLQASYSVRKRNVDVNIPIIIPNVEKLPILKVTALMPDMESMINNKNIVSQGMNGYLLKYEDVGLEKVNLQNGGGTQKVEISISDGVETIEKSILVTCNDAKNLRSKIHGETNAGYDKSVFYPWEYTDIGELYAENNNYSLSDALNYLEIVLNHYYPSCDNDKIEIDYIEIRGRLRKKNKNKSLGETYNEYPSGTYNIHYFQKLHGIPILMKANNMYDYSKLMDTKINETEFDKLGYISNLQNEAEVMYPYEDLFMENCFLEEIDEKYEDVPLASIDDVISNIENELKKGYIRNIYSLRLGYGLFLDPEENRQKQQEVSYVLYPIWVMECDYLSDLSRDIRENTDSTDFRDGYSFKKLCFNAQTGDVINRETPNKKCLECPNVIIW